MKDIKTAKQFYKLFTDKELTVLSIEQKMQLYAEYYHKAKVEEKANIIIEKIKEIQIIEHDNYDKGRNAGLNDAIHIIHMEVLT